MSCANIRLRLDEFSFRQFDDPSYVGTKLPISRDAFMSHLQTVLKNNPNLRLVDGYAPFCKHIFVPNWIPNLHVGCISINDKNKHLLQSGYISRTDKELAVLCRWFPSDRVQVPDATFLDLILYSKAQIIEESISMNNPIINEEYDWGLISIKAQDQDFEQPMSPITIMRNSLGKNEGGSGVEINRQAYIEAVKFWDQHASIVHQDNNN